MSSDQVNCQGLFQQSQQTSVDPPQQSDPQQQGQYQQESVQNQQVNNNESKCLLKQDSYQYPSLNCHKASNRSEECSQKQQEKQLGVASHMNEQKQPSGSILICVDDNEMIPNTNLIPSPKDFKPHQVKIEMYKTTTFMKIQTQVFTLDVINRTTSEEYQIERRFSDFADLYESVFYNQPGYILSPFPGKSIESFIKIKLGIGYVDEGQRCEMIEKRMQQLQNFVNFLTHHQYLSNCEQLNIFLLKDNSRFIEEKKRIQKFVEEYKVMEKNSQFKNLVEKGKSIFKYYYPQDQPAEKHEQSLTHPNLTKKSLQFAKVHEHLRHFKLKAEELNNKALALFHIQKKYSQFQDIETDIDILLKVCAKHSSTREFCAQLMDNIEVKVLDQLQQNIKWVESIEKVLMYRLELLEIIKEAQSSNNSDIYSKLQRRVEKAEVNFLYDWPNRFDKLERTHNEAKDELIKQWGRHKELMKKVWKN